MKKMYWFETISSVGFIIVACLLIQKCTKTSNASEIAFYFGHALWNLIIGIYFLIRIKLNEIHDDIKENHGQKS